MIRAIGQAITQGGDQSIAASRGEGKTQIARRLILKYVLSGKVKFAVLFAATATDAGDSLQAIRSEIEENDLLLDYYPEVCASVRALENTPNRAHYQTVTGIRHDNGQAYSQVSSRFSWCGHEIYLPNVPGSPSAGAVIATRGLDSSVRGMNKKGRRPDVAIIDDPDTEETARSEEQAKKLEDRIDRAIAGLGGQQRGIARVILTTLQNRTCVSYRFTDPIAKPTWKGKRFRFLLNPPARQDLWSEYVQILQDNMRSIDASGEPLDPFGRKAHQFYLKHRKQMDAGAKVANPHRYDSAELHDGTKLEASALQRYYNMVARFGEVAVATEYDNDPPEETGPVESSITPHRIQGQRGGYDRRVVPNAANMLVQGLDVGKYAIHWVVRAWTENGVGYTIDYGVEDVHNTKRGTEEGEDLAIYRAILSRMELAAVQYANEAGDHVPLRLSLIDSRYRMQAVKRACKEIGLGIRPALGHGKSSGCTTANFRDVFTRTPNRKPGDGWFETRSPGGIWVVNTDADRWKAWEHDRWMSPTGTPGSLQMFGERDMTIQQERAHRAETHAYSHSVCNEKEVEEIVRGTLKRYWKTFGPNHWLDASALSDVAANILGLRIEGTAETVSDTMSAIQAKGGWFASQSKRR